MTGKSILLMVLGFITIYAFIGFKLNTVSVSAVDNMADYYEETAAKNIASTGANIAANRLFLDDSYEGELTIDTIYGGEMDVSVETVDEFTELKVIRSVGTIERINEPDIVREVRITVRPSKFSKFAYFCENEPDNIWWYGTDTVWGPMHVNSKINVWGTPTYMGKVTCLKGINIYDDPGTHPVFNGGLEVGVDMKIPDVGMDKLKQRAQDDGWYITGNKTVYMEIKGDRIKYKKSPTEGGYVGAGGYSPVLEKGWVSIVPQSAVEPGNTVTFSFRHESLTCSDFDKYKTYTTIGSHTNMVKTDDCYLTVDIPADAVDLQIYIMLDKDDFPELHDDQEGKVKWLFIDDYYTEGHTDEGYKVENIEDLAPNGVIYVEGGDVRLQGQLDGRITIAAGKDETGTFGGTVWLDDDITYQDDPRDTPSSNDLLGICAEENVMITDNNPNNSDINIHAAIYAENGGFGAENPHSRGFSGDIKLLGGITQKERLAVGSTAGDGFWKKYKYDQRLMDASPPAFPGTGGFEIVSWFQ